LTQNTHSQPVGEHTAQDDAGGTTGTGDGTPDAHRLVAFLVPGEGDGHQGERGRRQDRAAESLEGAGRDQLTRVVGQTAGQRGQAEQDESAEEDALASEEVGRSSAHEEEAAESQHVGVDHPRQTLLGEIEVVLDRR
jgi:hypothetical protein